MYRRRGCENRVKRVEEGKRTTEDVCVTTCHQVVSICVCQGNKITAQRVIMTSEGGMCLCMFGVWISLFREREKITEQSKGMCSKREGQKVVERSRRYVAVECLYLLPCVCVCVCQIGEICLTLSLSSPRSRKDLAFRHMPGP